jgi:arsenical pump membrane protein
VVFRGGLPPLGRWLATYGVPSLLSIAATYLVVRIFFHRELAESCEGESEQIFLSKEGFFVLIGLILVAATLLIASAFDKDLGLPTCLAALAITGAISLKSRSNPLRVLKEISWSTLALVAGLFIMVEAVESRGALGYTQHALNCAQNLAPAAGALLVSFVVGIANNLVNNLPLGLIAGATLQAAHTKGLIATAVMIGVDLGPNLSITGSLATILWLIALRREKQHVSFGSFFKVGIIAMPVALLAAMAGAILMQSILHLA